MYNDDVFVPIGVQRLNPALD